MVGNKFFAFSSAIFVAVIFIAASFIFVMNTPVGSADHDPVGPDCGSYTTESSCIIYPECGWASTDNYCFYSADATVCPYTTEATCTSYPECSWDFSGCYYAGNPCLADGEYFDTFSNACVFDCELVTTETVCTSHPECYVAETTGSEIGGGGPLCGYIGTGEVCEQVLTPARNTATGKCFTYSDACLPEGWVTDPTCDGGQTCSAGSYYDPATGGCQIDCAYYTTQNDCGFYSECSWDETYNYCGYGGTVATGCESYATEPTCTVDPSCGWDSAYTVCYYAGVSEGDAGITGIVTDSLGVVVPNAWVDLQTPDYAFSRGESANSQGVYTILNVPAGVYELKVRPPDGAGGLFPPAPISVTLVSGQTITQNITLLKSSKTITGRVTYPNGTGVSDAGINAWQPDSDAYAEAMTDSSGNYTLSATGGFWEISVWPASSNTDWNYNKEPQSVVFAPDTMPEEIVVNFTVISVNATIKGKVLRPDGTPPARDSVFIDFEKTEGLEFERFGAQVDMDGSFNARLTAGTYRIFIWSEDRTFTSPDIPSITVSVGATVDLGTITLVKASKVIRGKVLYEDGRPVTDAGVGAWQDETQNWSEGKVDASGNFSVLVSGGTWEVMIQSTGIAPDWTYNKPPHVVNFAKDKTPEERIVNFTVLNSDAAVIGRVLLPDGTAPRRDSVFISFGTGSGFGAGGQVDSSGAFRVSLVAGTYNVFIYSDDPSLAAPELPPISIASGETKDLGVIRLTTKSDKISGRVSDASGKGIGGIEVSAWTPDGFDYSVTRTDSAGAYSLLVSPGKWEVYAHPDATATYYNPDPPKRIEVKSGTLSIVNFTLFAADAGLTGTIVDKNGNTLSNLYGHVELLKHSGFGTLEGGGADFGPGVGGPIERGTFSLKAPAGTYFMHVFLPPESPYTAGDPQQVVITSGATTKVTVVVSENNSTITGTIRDKNGSAVTNVDIFVFATSQNGAWQEAFVDRATGKYTINVSPGTWYLGYHVDPNSGYLSADEGKFEVLIGEGQTITRDIALAKAGSKIGGRITDPTGAGVPYVWVEISRISFSGIEEFIEESGFVSPFVGGSQTDEKGNYSIAVPAGTYFVSVFIPPHLGYIAPEEKKVTAPEGSSAAVDLRLRKADLTISGKVWVGSITVPDAFVWGWSEKGGYQETITALDGSFRLNVSSNDVWHIAGGAEIDNEFYKANEITVNVGTEEVTADIYLAIFGTLAPPAVRIVDAEKPTVVQSASGVTVTAPARSLATEGNVTITVTPDTRVPSQGSTKVIGIAYEFEARDEQGIEIIKFNADVTISIPYDEATLADLGTDEDKLRIGFWDETLGKWQDLDTCAVNKEDNIVTCTVDHFTRFAIVSAADVTAPAAPVSVIAVALGDGKIKISWTNPTSDFSHAKVYRSEVMGDIGTTRVSEVSGSEFTDTGVADGVIYYYTVRSVDPAGNESSNTDQVSVVAQGTSKEVPQVVGINEGDLIRGSDGIKVYIVNALGFKRHIFNPAVFDMYQHFSWESIKEVSQGVADSYQTSDLYRSLEDPKVYSLEEVNEAAGIATKHHIEMTPEQFLAEGYVWNQVFIVNDQERDYYETGAPLTSNK